MVIAAILIVRLLSDGPTLNINVHLAQDAQLFYLHFLLHFTELVGHQDLHAPELASIGEVIMIEMAEVIMIDNMIEMAMSSAWRLSHGLVL